jgi:hypothetical protein
MITKNCIFSEMWLTVNYTFVCIYTYTQIYIEAGIGTGDGLDGRDIGVRVPVR